MAMMTAAALLALIASRQCIPPILAPIAVGMALHENPSLDTNAVNRHNRNGTIDYGLGQINSSNFGWLSASMRTPINEKTITDPCINLTAALRVLFARYNGNPPDAVKAAYADGAALSIAALDPVATGPPPPPLCAPSWDAWALAACTQHTRDSKHD